MPETPHGLTEEQLRALPICTEKRLTAGQRTIANDAIARLGGRPVNAFAADRTFIERELNYMVERNIANIDDTNRDLVEHLTIERLGAVMAWKKWGTGSKLNIKFFGGSDFVRAKVQFFAKMWESVVNIELNFVEDDFPSDQAQIRIAFQSKGSWCYEGTDALAIPADEQTMNFGWFDNDTEDAEFMRTTLHEFGHALGGIHEHYHPGAGIPWNKPLAYAYYQHTQGWTPEEVDAQVFAVIPTAQLQYGTYDPDSIMHYPVPEFIVLDPGAAVGWNGDLSTLDRLFFANQYPPS